MTISIIAILILVGILALVRGRQSRPEGRPQPKRPPVAKPTTEYHAVSIKVSGHACEAAKKMEGKRFLSSAAPKLPLADCDVLECKCRFVHHGDRRRGEERRSGLRSSLSESTGKHRQERRHRGDRRDDSPDDYFS